MSIVKKIRYTKENVVFDYFEIWLGEYNIFDHELFEIKGKLEDRATCVSTQICPWCVKKYGLYEEVERTPESINEEIEFYKNEKPEEFDFTCGIDGCNNGLADYVDINWDEGFEIVDKED